MPKVFISYSRSDSASAIRVYDHLRTIKDIEPWLDTYSLLTGMQWRPAIRKAIREANYFIALISTRSAAGRGFRHSELNQALEIASEFPHDHVFLIPARLDECDMPREELLDLTWVDFFPNWNDGMEKLIKSITPRKDQITNNLLKTSIESRAARYHYRVGLVDLDLGLINLANIAKSLNECQRFFLFVCPQMPTLENVVVNIGGIRNLAVYRIPKTFISEHQHLAVDLVTCITKHPLAFEEGNQILYNYFAGPSDDDERFLFVSTDQLYDFCRQAERSFEEGLVLTLVGQLAAYFTKLGYHSTIRGCVMDFCELRSDQIIGLRSRKFCTKCQDKLSDGELKTALEQLLSWTY